MRKSTSKDQKQIKEQKATSFVHEPSEQGRFLSIVQDQLNYLSLKQEINIIDEFDFKNLIQNNFYYVDKSLLLSQLFHNKVNLITRPRRWGKSLACHMVSCFYKMERDKNGQKLQDQPYLNYFRGGKIDTNQKQLQPLKIWKQKKQFCQKHQAKYPVLHLTLSKAINGGGYVESKLLFIKVLNYSLRKQFHYIKKLEDESNEIIMYCEQLEKLINISKLNHIKDKEQIKNFDIISCLRIIFDGITAYHKQKCILIIDQFDAPVTSMMKNAIKNTQCLELAIQFTAIFQSLSKNSTNIRFILLTGILNTLRLNGESNLNNVQINSVYTKKNIHAKYYGFSKQEIQTYLINQILEDPKSESNKKVKELIFKRIDDWYNGYNHFNDKEQVKIYNPYSIIKYLKKCVSEKIIAQGQSYWTQTSSNEFIPQIFQKMEKKNIELKMLQLIKYLKFQDDQEIKENQDKISQNIKNQKFVELRFNPNIQITNLIQNRQKKEEEIQQQLTSLLINLGYLTIGNQITYQNKIKCYIPNKQIRNYLRKQFSNWMQKRNFFIDLSSVNVISKQQFTTKMIQVYDELKQNYVFSNQWAFSSIFAARISMAHKRNENNMRTGVQIYSGKGIIDTVFYPKKQSQQNKKYIIIHEYKYSQSSEIQKIKQERHFEALYQILVKNYIQFAINLHKKNQKRVEMIILRGILIIHDRQNKKIQLDIKEIHLKMEQAYDLYQYFRVIDQEHKDNQKNNEQKDKKKKPKEVIQQFYQILKKTQTKNYQQLLKKIFNDAKQQRKRQETQKSEKSELEKKQISKQSKRMEEREQNWNKQETKKGQKRVKKGK